MGSPAGSIGMGGPLFNPEHLGCYSAVFGYLHLIKTDQMVFGAGRLIRISTDTERKLTAHVLRTTTISGHKPAPTVVLVRKQMGIGLDCSFSRPLLTILWT
jgi:hypothetical protein